MTLVLLLTASCHLGLATRPPASRLPNDHAYQEYHHPSDYIWLKLKIVARLRGAVFWRGQTGLEESLSVDSFNHLVGRDPGRVVGDSR